MHPTINEAADTFAEPPREELFRSRIPLTVLPEVAGWPTDRTPPIARDGEGADKFIVTQSDWTYRSLHAPADDNVTESLGNERLNAASVVEVGTTEFDQFDAVVQFAPELAVH
jgi:hypothetical protein